MIGWIEWSSSFGEQYVLMVANAGSVRNIGNAGGGSCTVIAKTLSSSETVYVSAYQGSSASVNARAAIYAIKIA